MNNFLENIFFLPVYVGLVVVFAALVVIGIRQAIKGSNRRIWSIVALASLFCLSVLAILGLIYQPPENWVTPKDNVVMCDMDFSKDEYAKRFTIEPLDYTGYCASGSGEGFSNVPESHCSSLGLYKVTGSKLSKKVGPALILEGLSSTNSNARSRGILVHGSKMVNLWRYGIKRRTTRTSEGCFTVDSRTLDKLMTLHRRGMSIFIIAHK